MSISTSLPRAPPAADSQEYLLVHRYDRGRETPDGRIHQEDFCQALGLVPAVKYEKEGGPTVADCAELIRRRFSAPARDITFFLDALLFNFAIANHDAHSKKLLAPARRSRVDPTGASLRPHLHGRLPRDRSQAGDALRRRESPRVPARSPPGSPCEGPRRKAGPGPATRDLAARKNEGRRRGGSAIASGGVSGSPDP